MPVRPNRYGGGGSGRYYHAESDGRSNKNKSNTSSIPPSAHVKATAKLDKEAKPNTDSISSKSALQKDENSKFKPTFSSPSNEAKSSGATNEDRPNAPLVEKSKLL